MMPDIRKWVVQQDRPGRMIWKLFSSMGQSICLHMSRRKPLSQVMDGSFVTLASYIHTLFMPLRLLFSLAFNIVECVLVANYPIGFCERKKRRESELLVRELCAASENGDLSRLLDVLEDIIRGKKMNDGDVASIYPIKRKNV